MPRLTPILAAVAAALALSTAAVAAPALSPQTSSEAAVMITVTPRAVAPDAWEFEVALNTHSKALDDDLLKSAVLVTADGKRIAPSAWRGDGPGGHHRKGVLRFDAVAPSAAGLDLRISRAGEARPRSFHWALQ